MSLATIGTLAPANYRHIVLNNGTHDSVGGQPTAGFKIDFRAIAMANGYIRALRAETAEDLAQAAEELVASPGPSFLEVRVDRGSRSDLGRPTIPPRENRSNFMRFLNT